VVQAASSSGAVRGFAFISSAVNCRPVWLSVLEARRHRPAVLRVSAQAFESRARSLATKICKLMASWTDLFLLKVTNSRSAPMPGSLPKFTPVTSSPTEKWSAMFTRAAASTLSGKVQSPAIFHARASASRTALISKVASKSTRPKLRPPPISSTHYDLQNRASMLLCTGAVPLRFINLTSKLPE